MAETVVRRWGSLGWWVSVLSWNVRVGWLGRGSCQKMGITGLMGKCFALVCAGGVSWPREL